MSWIGEQWRRVKVLLHRDRLEQDLADEMRLHLELRAEEKMAGGLSQAGAKAAARRKFGNFGLIQEHSRDAWGWRWLETFAHDLRYAARTLRANPGFAGTAILSLALGIGANAAIFNIMNAVMLRPLPVAQPDRLVQLQQSGATELTNPIWEEIRDHQRAFSGLLAYCGEAFNLSDGGERRNAEGIFVSGSFFEVLGVRALQGRTLMSSDDTRGAARTAVISYRFWKRNYPDGAPVVGTTIRLNRQPFEIVGVTPEWFTGLDVDRSYDVAIPIAAAPAIRGGDPGALDSRSYWWLTLMGRLNPDESMTVATQKLNALAPEIMRATVEPKWPEEVRKDFLSQTYTLHPAGTGFSDTGERYGKALLTLMATVGLVLLIACANIANLMLARSAARQREISVRMAIGAGRWRLIRQLMTESLLLSSLGASAGFLLALWGSKALVQALSRTGRTLDLDVAPDVRVMGFTLGITVLTAILFGLAPAIQATRSGLSRALKENTRGAVHGAGRLTLGKALVSGQVALSLVLVVAAALFLGTLRNLLTVDAGFDRRNVLLVRTDLRQAGIPAPQREAAFGEILGRLRGVPGVISASTSMLTPISGAGWNSGVRAEGFTPQSRADSMVMLNRVSSGYFQTMRIPVLVGREFSAQDDVSSQKVIVLDQSSAQHFLGTANPVGRMIELAGPSGKGTPYEVIGVVKDAKYRRLNEAVTRTAYLPASQEAQPGASVNFEVRYAGALSSIVPGIRAIFAEVNRGISLDFQDFETQVSDSILQQRLVARLSAAFGVLALVLAMVGLYGITSYGVARRRSEIGVRMALGAQRGSVIWLMMRGMLGLLALGIAVGLAISLATSRLVATLLYGVRPNEPAHLIVATATLAAAAILAAWLPARRAARLDPMSALREE